MEKKIVWLVMSGLMALSLVMAACGPAAPAEKTEVGEKKVIVQAEEEKEKEKEVVQEEEVVAPTGPQYGGILRLATNSDILGWDDVVTRSFTPGAIQRVTNEAIWQGDWAKGPAGGFGTNESDWASNYDVFAHKGGHIAESWSWSVDAENDTGTLIYQIRQGVHYALNTESEASRLVGGREMTADDVVYSLKAMAQDPRGYIYRANPDLNDAEITKTGPWEVTIKVSKIGTLIQAISRFGNYGRVVPPEVVEKYGDMGNWKVSVGTGPFMLTDYVAGSAAIMDRNPNYWQTDPVGPGRGNQLPYIDGYKLLIIPDLSTRQAALRSGQIDQMASFNWEDAAVMRQTAPDLMETEGGLTGPTYYVYMNTQKAPFDNVKVRRALQMAVDLDAIRDALNNGLGQVLTWPAEYINAYRDLYLGLDDPDMPESVKELYVYNPEKAKQLLAEAGYPNGFKATALLSSTPAEADYYSIIKDMWSKIGVDLELDVNEGGALRIIYNKGEYDVTGSAGGRGPISIFYLSPTLVGNGSSGGNGAQVDDPFIHAAMDKIRTTSATDLTGAMKQYRELMKYVLDQAYVIQRPIYPSATFWWPWLKNYSGEITMGYFVGDFWATHIWYDQELKKDMGH